MKKMRKMICMMVIYFMVTVFRIKSFISNQKKEVKKIKNSIKRGIENRKEITTNVLKRATAILLEVYLSGMVKKTLQMLTGLNGIMLFIAVIKKRDNLIDIHGKLTKVFSAASLIWRLIETGIEVCV